MVWIVLVAIATWTLNQDMEQQVNSGTDSSIQITWIHRTQPMGTEADKAALTPAPHRKWWAVWVKTTWCRITTRVQWVSSNKWPQTTPVSTVTSCLRTTSTDREATFPKTVLRDFKVTYKKSERFSAHIHLYTILWTMKYTSYQQTWQQNEAQSSTINIYWTYNALKILI